MRKYRIFILPMLLCLLLLTASMCDSGKTGPNVNIEEIRTGSEGIIFEFMGNNPPSEIYVAPSGDNAFTVAMMVRNKGAYPQPTDLITGLGPTGKLFLTGYDPNIIKFKVKEQQDATYADLGKMAVEGKSTINPNGGQDIVSFVGEIIPSALNVKVYEPTFLATSCYYYETVSEEQICVDPIPYSTMPQRKVCTVADKALTGQGAPIAVTAINAEPFSTKTQFKITVKNIGNGEVMRFSAVDKCGPYPNSATIEREDLNKVRLESVEISGNHLSCGPFSDEGNVKSPSGTIKLIDGEGYVICDLPSSEYKDKQNAYTTPITIILSYGYRSSIQRSLKIIKED